MFIVLCVKHNSIDIKLQIRPLSCIWSFKCTEPRRSFLFLFCFFRDCVSSEQAARRTTSSTTAMRTSMLVRLRLVTIIPQQTIHVFLKLMLLFSSFNFLLSLPQMTSLCPESEYKCVFPSHSGCVQNQWWPCDCDRRGSDPPRGSRRRWTAEERYRERTQETWNKRKPTPVSINAYNLSDWDASLHPPLSSNRKN